MYSLKYCATFALLIICLIEYHLLGYCTIGLSDRHTIPRYTFFCTTTSLKIQQKRISRISRTQSIGIYHLYLLQFSLSLPSGLLACLYIACLYIACLNITCLTIAQLVTPQYILWQTHHLGVQNTVLQNRMQWPHRKFATSI